MARMKPTVAILFLILVAGCARTERSTTSESQDTSASATGSPIPSQNPTSDAPASGADSPDSPGSDLPAAVTDPDVVVTKPTAGETVSSPLTVWGEARGPWYFEASFPVKLLDAQGQVLATGPAQAKGDWMTPDLVPYEVTLRFTPPPAGTVGRVVLEKSNASGDPARADQVVVPVRF